MDTNRKVRVNIIVGRFQPITKGHLKCIKYIWEKYNTPTVILMIDTKVPNERHPFTSNILVPMYKELFKSSPMIADILLVKNADIVTNHELLMSKGYEAKLWVCGTDRYDSYKKLAEKYHDKAGLPNDFEVIEIKRTDEDESATKARQCLIDGDEKGFYKIFPDHPSKINAYKILKDLIDKLE